MKKTLLSLAVLGAMTGSACAADVTVYGLVDYGMQYKGVHETSDGATDHSFGLQSGMNSGSRFGFKGTEDLGNGLTVGFVLESGFTADDGKLDNGGRIFGREAQVYLSGDFGTISFGRVGQLMSANGTWGLMGKYSVFSGGWGSYTGGKYFHAGNWGRIDNTISYASPSLDGFRVYAQYSFKMDSTGDSLNADWPSVEGKPSSDRHMAAALTFEQGDLGFILAGELTDWANHPRAEGGKMDFREHKDELNGLLAVTYDFQVAKLYVSGQYYKNVRTKAWDTKTPTGLQGALNSFLARTGYAHGRAFTAGADIPAFGGTFKTEFGYRYAACNYHNTNNVSQYAGSVGYTYDLSKNTSLYAAGTWVYMENSSNKDHAEYLLDANAWEAMAGMIHKF